MGAQNVHFKTGDLVAEMTKLTTSDHHGSVPLEKVATPRNGRFSFENQGKTPKMAPTKWHRFRIFCNFGLTRSVSGDFETLFGAFSEFFGLSGLQNKGILSSNRRIINGIAKIINTELHLHRFEMTGGVALFVLQTAID